MTARLGLSIASDACAAIVVRGGRVKWSSHVDRLSNAPIAPLLAELLARPPIGRRTRVRIGVSLGVSCCQLKKIHGVPKAMRADVAARLVSENTSSFFLRSSSRLVTTGVERGADGSVWCAALDGAVVDETVEALRAAGFKSLVVVPQPLADAIVLSTGSHRAIDGNVVAEFSTTDRRTFTHVQRRMQDDASGAIPAANLPRPLRTLGDSAPLYVSAFGAAMCPPDRALAWRPPVDPRAVRRRQRARSIVVAATLVASVGAVLTAPTVRAARDAADSLRLAEHRQATANEAAQIDRRLRSVTASLDRVDRFTSRRGELPLLLAELARAMPESTALLSLRVDTIDVSLSVLTPHAADVVAELASAEGVVSPRIVGSVMRDAGTREALERATIRFRRRRQ